ncbi:hypothetical protein [Streptomyces sp. NBC_00091]|uniref:hypothetical protein n=1 Tax=Streptomyces sp. NBC_00091 TaxID=2975648 RepID=UPI00225687E3|nr:hypothetical protein [Streptomyces sp. NBC_00091]MCX5375857.1 hypothetical protein [Streptomyces sp. NBC_00091]
MNTLAWIFLIAAGAAALGLVLMKRTERARLRARRAEAAAAAEASAEPQRPAEAPFREAHLDQVAVPSLLPDYDFLLSASVWWRPAGTEGDVPHGNRAGLAVASVIRRAQELTRRERPDRYGSVQYLLEERLGSHALDDSATLVVMATDVTLTLVPEDRDRLRRLAGLRKEEDTWEQERQYERSKRKYLADEILQSPGSAVVWWLARHDEDIERAVDLLGPLAQLSAASNNTEVVELFRHLVDGPPEPGPAPWPDDDTLPRDHPQHEPPDVVARVEAFLEDLGLGEPSAERQSFLHRLLRLLAAAGRQEEAERVRSRLWTESTTEDPTPAPPPEDTGDSEATTNPWPTDPGTP